ATNNPSHVTIGNPMFFLNEAGIARSYKLLFSQGKNAKTNAATVQAAGATPETLKKTVANERRLGFHSSPYTYCENQRSTRTTVSIRAFSGTLTFSVISAKALGRTRSNDMEKMSRLNAM